MRKFLTILLIAIFALYAVSAQGNVKTCMTSLNTPCKDKTDVGCQQSLMQVIQCIQTQPCNTSSSVSEQIQCLKNCRQVDHSDVQLYVDGMIECTDQ